MAIWINFTRVIDGSNVTVNMERCTKIEADKEAENTAWLVFDGASPEHVTFSYDELVLTLGGLTMSAFIP